MCLNLWLHWEFHSVLHLHFWPSLKITPLLSVCFQIFRPLTWVCAITSSQGRQWLLVTGAVYYPLESSIPFWGILEGKRGNWARGYCCPDLSHGLPIGLCKNAVLGIFWWLAIRTIQRVPANRISHCDTSWRPKSKNNATYNECLVKKEAWPSASLVVVGFQLSLSSKHLCSTLKAKGHALFFIWLLQSSCMVFP